MFLKSHYFWRTYLGYVAVALAGTWLFAASLVPRNSEQVQENVRRDMEVTSDSLALYAGTAIGNLDYQGLRETADSVALISGLRITIIDQNGVMLADSHEDPFSMDNHFRRPEVQSALANGSGAAQRYSYTLEESFRYLAKRVEIRGQLGGFVRVAMSEADLAAEIRQSHMFIIRNASIISFVALLIAFYLAARQAAKVEDITAVTEEISRGNFARRIPEGNSVGLKKLAESINQMARSSARRVTDVTADRNRLSTVFTCMVEGVIDVDMDQNVLHINEAAAKLLQVNEKESIGKPLWQEVRNREILNALDQAISTQSVIKAQMRLNRESDQLVVDIYAASLSNDDGEPIGAVLVLHDITELKNLERIRTDFVANASHELKTPITAIRGLTETILEDDKVDRQTMVQFIGRVHAQSLRLSQLVGDLMTISRLESSHNQEDFARINFADLARQAVRAGQVVAEDKGQDLDAELPETEVMVMGDRQNLSQLLDNLIDNAIKYTTDSGTITVRVFQEDGFAVLQVSDTGIGISPQFQQRVFERFYRVDKARSQSLGGTGLGLSIVKNIAEKHGGSISVKSQLGMGSTFTIRLPQAT
jgi:two-component system phosphate regulon sensor histidine kinase PhoR